MADIESNIDINIDVSNALASIRALQREISLFHTNMSKGGAAATARSAELQQGLINTINASGKFSAQMRTIQSTTESFTQSLERNKLSMGQYFRYAGASTKTFGRLFGNEFSTIEKVARERVKTLQTQYIKLGRDANGAMRSIAVRPLALDMDDFGTKSAIAAQKVQLFNQLVKQGSTNLLNWGKNTQWAGRQLMVGFSIPLGIAGAMASREFMKLEEQALRFKRVYGDTFTPSAEADAMIEQVRELALEFTKYGASVEQTMGIAADAAAMGLQGAELTAQVAQATRLAILGGVEQSQALETTISLTNAFGTATEELANKTNFLNAVENQTVTSIEDLTIAIPKAGPVVQQLGGDVEDLAFFLTAMKEGGINASEGANALKSGLASLINPTDKASEMLAGFGINIQEIVNANKGDVKGIVIDFAKALDTLDPLNRAQAIEQLFGKFQFARLSTLFQNVIAEGSQASRVLELTNATTAELGALAERELKRLEDSPMYQFKAAVEEFKVAIAPIGEIFMELVTPFIKFGTDVLNKFNDLDEGIKSFITGAIAIAGGIAPILIMSIGLIANFIASTIKAFSTLLAFTQRTKSSTTMLGQQTEYMTNQQLEAAAVAASLGQVHNTLTQQFTSERNAVRLLAQAYQEANAKAQAFSTIPMRPGTPAPRKMATGGIVRGPGTGTSDSVPAMLSNNEAVIPAASVKKYPGMVAGLIAGNIPGYQEGFDPQVKGFSNATMFLPESENIALRSGTPTSNISGFLKQAGPSAMAPMVAAIASAMGTRITPANMPEFKALGEKLSRSAVQALAASGIKTVTDADLERMLRPAFEEATKDIEIGGERVSTALRKTFDEIRTVGPVNAKSGQTGVTSRRSIGKGYQLLRTRSQKLALDWQGPAPAAGQPDTRMFAQRERISSSGRRVRQFVARNVSGRFEQGVMAHITEPITTSASKVAQKVKSYLGDKMSQIMKAAESGAVSGINSGGAKAKQSTAVAAQKMTQARMDQLNKIDRSVASNAPAPVVVADGSRRATRPQGPTGAGSGIMVFDPVSGNYFTEEKFRKQQSAREEAKRRLARMQKPSVGQRMMGGTRGMGVAGGAMSMGMMAAGSMGGPVGDIMGQLSMPIMLASTALSMIPGPAGIAAAALVGVGTVAVMAYKEFEKWKDGVREAAVATITTKKSMDALAEAAGTVNPAEDAKTIRAEQITGADIPGLENTFGGQYLASEAGKQYLQGIKQSLESQRAGDIAKKLGNQIAMSVASGILSIEQARSMAVNIGAELNNMNIATDINAKLQELLGPDGQNLLDGGTINVLANVVSETGQQATGRSSAIEYLAGAPQDMLGRILDQKNIVAAEIQAAADFVNLRTQSQQALDTLLINYEKKRKELADKGDQAALEAAKEQYDNDRQRILDEGRKQTENYIKQLKEAEGSTGFGSAAVAKEVFTIVKTQFEGDEQALKAIDLIGDQALTATAEIVFLADLQSGALQPEDIQSIMRLLSLKEQEAIAKFNVEFGPEASSMIAKTVGLFGTDKEGAKTFVANLELAAKQGDLDQVLTALDEINKYASIGDFELSVDILNTKDLLSLSKTFDKIDKAFADGPQTLEYAVNIAGLKNFRLLAADQAYFASLDKTQQIEYIRTITTVYQTRGTKEYKEGLKTWMESENIQGWKKDKKISKREREIMAQYEASLAQATVEASALKDTTGQVTEEMTGLDDASADANKESGSMLDSVVQKLKNVRNAAIGLTNTWRSSMDALMQYASGGVSGFAGIENQLRGLGAGEDAISMITGMSQEDWDQYKNELFAFDGAGNITGITQQFHALNTALREIKLGEFFSQQQKTIEGFRYQQAAVQKLVGAGMSYAHATEIAKDAELAQAIATSANAEEMRQLANATREAEQATKNFAAMQAVATKAQETADRRKLISAMMQDKRLTDVQKEALLSDENLAQLYLNPNISPEQLDQAMKDAQNAAQLEIDAKKLTFKGLVSIFEDGFSKAMEAFAAREKQIQLRFDIDRKPFEDMISGAQQMIADINDAPGGIDDLNAELERISRIEDDVNKKYDERIKAIDEIASANERIAKQQQSQLTLADALSRGDISAAAAAAQAMRAEQTANAITQEREAIDAARKLELENVMATMGLNREQIETRIRDLKQQIFDIEENIIEPAQYQIELLNRQQQIEIDSLTILGKTKDEWTNIGNQVDVAKTSTDEYVQAMQNALSVVADILNHWEGLERTFTTEHKVHTVYTQTGTPPVGIGGGTQNTYSDSKESSTGSGTSSSGTTNSSTSSSNKPRANYDPAKFYPRNVAEYAISKNYWQKEYNRTKVPGTLRPSAAFKVAEQKLKELEEIRYKNSWPIAGVARANGGLIPSTFASGGLAKIFGQIGSDTVPAILTPGEFVVKRASVKEFGVDNLRAINNGTFSGGSVYNYGINVNVRSEANPDEIARSVMTQIQRIESQRIRGNRF